MKLYKTERGAIIYGFIYESAMTSKKDLYMLYPDAIFGGDHSLEDGCDSWLIEGIWYTMREGNFLGKYIILQGSVIIQQLPEDYKEIRE